MIPKLGPMELAIILLVVLVLFGPKNLPKLGSALGATMKNLREGMNGDSSKAVKAAAETPSGTSAEAVDEVTEAEAEPVAAKPAPKSAVAAAGKAS